MAEDPDARRLEDLEKRIAAARSGGTRKTRAQSGLGQGEVAWRMVIELVTGIALGLAIGYGLDSLLGTRPVMMVIFVLLGFGAGVRTMLGTAAGLTAKPPENDPADGKRD